jgi:hypothetical protein
MTLALIALALSGVLTCHVNLAGKMMCSGTDGSYFQLVMPSPTPWATPTPFPAPPSGPPYCGKGIVYSNGRMCIQ